MGLKGKRNEITFKVWLGLSPWNNKWEKSKGNWAWAHKIKIRKEKRLSKRNSRMKYQIHYSKRKYAKICITRIGVLHSSYLERYQFIVFLTENFEILSRIQVSSFALFFIQAIR